MSESIDHRTEPSAPAPEDREASLRAQAVQQIERRRRFRLDLAVSTMIMLLVTGIWAVTEYNNAGGWPTEGFSESSSIPNVWNMWIVYPFLGWAFYVGVRAWVTYLRKPISERDIEREMERRAGTR